LHIAYSDDYKLLLIATLAMLPLFVVLKKPRRAAGEHAIMMEKRLPCQ
jgi:hypothetical protein